MIARQSSAGSDFLPSRSLSTSPIARTLESRQPQLVALRWLLIGMLAAMAVVQLRTAVQALLPPDVYRKDFVQEYLLPKAVLAGLNPYLPLPQLAEGLLELPDNTPFHHASPHPPPVAMLSLPLALVPYEQAARVWFVVELICIFAAVHWLLRGTRWYGQPGWTALVGLLALAWPPFWIELVLGQLTAVLLVLLCAAWLTLRSGYAVRGGALLGGVIAVKLMAWPIVVFLALRRDWRAVGAAGAVAVGANLAAAILMGFGTVADYYLRVGSEVWPIYRELSRNFSAWSVGWRLFNGTGSPELVGLRAAPLVSLPWLAPALSLALPVVLLVVSLVLARRARSFDAAFGLLVCVSTVISPVAWIHYLMLLAIPVTICLRRLARLGWPRTESYAAAGIGLVVAIPPPQLEQIALFMAGEEPVRANVVTVPFVVGLITLLPLDATLSLMGVISRLDRVDTYGAPGRRLD